MLSAAPADRVRRDLCPGALTVHPAADGGLARIRVPGGRILAGQLRVLAAAAAELGNGIVELTSRGNVQLRGLAEGDEAALGQRLAAVGLLPSETHERVRNIVASPLAGLDGGPDLDAVLADLDRSLCARAALAGLPGRFLFALDDGRGDVAGLGADVTAVLGPSGATVEGRPVALDEVVPALLAVAEAFLAERTAQRSQAWRVDELVGGRAAVLDRAGRTFGRQIGRWVDGRTVPTDLPAPVPAPVGALVQRDGRTALVVLAPLGRLGRSQLELLAELTGPRGARVTPWRSVVLPDLPSAEPARSALAAVGLGVDAQSAWFGVSACTGRPGCAKSLADVQADAAEGVRSWPGRVVHWSGCERRCGRPHDTTVDIVAASDGYRISE